MTSRLTIPRRKVLRGFGACVALPWLEGMMARAAQTAAAAEIPRRAAFLYVPNGVSMDHWRPKTSGDDFELTTTLQPLAEFRDQMMVISGLTLDKARDHGDGGGDHARALSAFLTCCQPRKTSGADIRVGVSVDQIAAWKLGDMTRLPSLEIGCDAGNQVGNCDSGYSCAYSNNISWRTENTPQAKEVNPRLVFERLFLDESGTTAKDREKRLALKKSILDTVHSDANRLNSRLGLSDQRKLDEYLSSIRSIELQLEKAEKDNSQINPGMSKPYGVPADFAEHFKLMTDMITVAFQADLSRVVTFLVTREGSSRAYREIGIPDGHHPLTHHQNNPEMMEKVAQINHYHVKQFAGWIEKLKATKEGDSNLLANSMIAYGAGLSDGNRHTHEDLPLLIAGHAAGKIKSGRRIVYRKETPISNLFLTMMDNMGVKAEHFGDATGPLDGLNLA